MKPRRTVKCHFCDGDIPQTTIELGPGSFVNITGGISAQYTCPHCHQTDVYTNVDILEPDDPVVM